MKTLLIFGLQYPEPQSTAAGSRMLQLIDLFNIMSYDVHFACAQPITSFSVDLEKNAVKSHAIKLNDSSSRILLEELRPEVVMFDRFIAEEQFGWLVDEVCPNALKILDTEDLHFLRENREYAINKPDANFNEFSLSDKAKREIAAIYRCDLSLIISKIEMEILLKKFSLPKSILHYLPFLIQVEDLDFSGMLSFSERRHFVSIGNFKHKPNLDMVKHLFKNIWPNIKRELPEAEWHIYGAYLPQQVQEMHKPKDGFVVKGRAEEALQTLKNYRVMLAPLRFGAGLKGKCIDSMQAGTPSITTSIGAEGIASKDNWSGFVEDDDQAFSQSAILLYNDQNVWESKQKIALKLLKQNFDFDLFQSDFQDKIDCILTNITDFRTKNIVGEILKHHHHRSTKYMSLWIEEKNKNF